jgi:hypothetical protein
LNFGALVETVMELVLVIDVSTIKVQVEDIIIARQSQFLPDGHIPFVLVEYILATLQNVQDVMDVAHM